MVAYMGVCVCWCIMGVCASVCACVCETAHLHHLPFCFLFSPFAKISFRSEHSLACPPLKYFNPHMFIFACFPITGSRTTINGLRKYCRQFGYVPYDTCQPYEACSAESHEGRCWGGDYTCKPINICRTCNTFDAVCGECGALFPLRIAEGLRNFHLHPCSMDCRQTWCVSGWCVSGWKPAMFTYFTCGYVLCPLYVRTEGNNSRNCSN